MDTPKEIATQTVSNIVKELIENKKAANLNNDEINKILQKNIAAAYIEAGDDQKKEIYRALSLHLHPDKIRHPKLYAYLSDKKMIHAPFNWVNELNTVNLFHQITNDPMSGLRTSYNYVLEKLTPMFAEYERYWQPFRIVAQFATWLVLIPVFLAIAVTVIGFFIIASVVEYAEKLCVWLLDKVIQNQYSTELREFLTPNFAHLKKEHLNTIRQHGIESLIKENKSTSVWENMSDEALFDLLIDHACSDEIVRLEQAGVKIEDYMSIRNTVEDHYNQKILMETPVSGFIKLKLVILATYHTLKKLPSQNSFFLRVFQPVTTPFLIVAVTAIEGIRFFNTAVLFVATGSILFSLVASIGIINAPLYVVDFINYINKKTGRREPENTENTTNSCSLVHCESTDSNRGALAMLRLPHGEQKSVKKEEAYDIHQAFSDLFKEIDKFEQNIENSKLTTCSDIETNHPVPNNS